MLKRIKDINEALPGMLLIECIYLVVAQIIIFIAVPMIVMEDISIDLRFKNSDIFFSSSLI